MKKDFEGREFLREYERLARELRAKARGFAGLENPFASIQEKMLLEYKEAALLSHPGDKGTAREGVLRAFLKDKGYLPARFAVSVGSSHVISSTGHSSDQMDLIIYDAMNSPRLFAMSDIQYFPVECVYGVVEVKSNLDSANTVEDGLNKVASFKALRSSSVKADKGFGLLFAFEATLKWKTLVESVESWQRMHAATLWPNMVIVLNQAGLVQTKEGRLALTTEEISDIIEPALSPVMADDALLLTSIFC
jgi:hypothetical protein